MSGGSGVYDSGSREGWSRDEIRDDERQFGSGRRKHLLIDLLEVFLAASLLLMKLSWPSQIFAPSVFLRNMEDV